MFEERKLKRDLLALALLALVIFLTAALFSYDPADPPTSLVYPPHLEIHNTCGRSGAIVARLLFESLGIGAYYLIVSLTVLDAVLLMHRRISQPWLRAGGWLLSLVGLTALAAMALARLSPGPVIGPGGYLGATGRGLLELHFARVGAYIISVSLLVGGLLLTTDYMLIRAFVWMISMPTKHFGRGVLQVGAAYAHKLGRRRSDLDAYESDEVNDKVAVRISGRANEEVEATGDEDGEKAADQAGNDKKAVAVIPAGNQPAAKSAAKGKQAERQKLFEQFEPEKSGQNAADYELPSLDLLLPGETYSFDEHEKEVRRRAKILEKTFLDFGFNVRVVEIQTGPVIAQFEVELEAGLRLSKITALADDLAIALRVPSVRIVAPIPGKNTVGIEVPNTQRQIVRLREVVEEANGKSMKMRIPLYLGKDVAGNPLVVDLSTLPHLLIAGRTGTGKSVCLNSIIVSMLMTRRPDEVRMLLIDPKMVELSPYKTLPHLMHPVVTDMRKAEAILAWAVDKMEERYHLLARAGVRHVSVYNQLGEEELMERIQPEDDEERRQIPLHMPYIVIVTDELADLMMTAAKEVEGHIIRLAQKSRAVGIHLVLATQKPTVDVITGLIKSNLPARISFQVASRTDSRVVLDEMGADKLLGNGDMLFLWPGTGTLIRGQGTYLSDDEINRVIATVATSEPQFVKELVQLKATQPEGETKKFDRGDDLYESAVDIVIREGRGSVSLLQRALGIGYGRAARLIDYMAEDGIVGPYNGSQARDILITMSQWESMTGQAPATPDEAQKPKPRRTNKIFIAQPNKNAFDDEDLQEESLRDNADNDDDEPENAADEDDQESSPLSHRERARVRAEDEEYDEVETDSNESDEEEDESDEYEDDDEESDDDYDDEEGSDYEEANAEVDGESESNDKSAADSNPPAPNKRWKAESA
ncbi:MAG: DNA translocase FtsK 4TM domain-containing protein [Thermoguttaceae bacterium]|jgi:S-DNA-T family DNA segregation ATPase FtsK/SpoIIIE